MSGSVTSAGRRRSKKRSKFVNSSILRIFTAIKKIKFKVFILNADWLVVNTRLIFIGCRQGCDYTSEKVRLIMVIEWSAIWAEIKRVITK